MDRESSPPRLPPLKKGPRPSEHCSSRFPHQQTYVATIMPTTLLDTVDSYMFKRSDIWAKLRGKPCTKDELSEKYPNILTPFPPVLPTTQEQAAKPGFHIPESFGTVPYSRPDSANRTHRQIVVRNLHPRFSTKNISMADRDLELKEILCTRRRQPSEIIPGRQHSTSKAITYFAVEKERFHKEQRRFKTDKFSDLFNPRKGSINPGWEMNIDGEAPRAESTSQTSSVSPREIQITRKRSSRVFNNSPFVCAGFKSKKRIEEEKQIKEEEEKEKEERQTIKEETEREQTA